jgi:hypothetical protein
MAIQMQIKDTPSFKTTDQAALLAKRADPLFQTMIKKEWSRILYSFLVIKTRKVSYKNQFVIDDPEQHVAAHGDSDDNQPHAFFKPWTGKNC